MAKGARRKTKWVSLSLANTTTSVAAGSDSEQQPHQQSNHHHHGGHRQKTLNGAASTMTKYSGSGKEVDSSEEHHSNEPLDTAESGNRTDTSGSGSRSGSDSGPNGYASSSSERRPGAGSYQRRRPPPHHHTRSSWTAAGGAGSLTNGRGTLYSGGNRTGYYNNGGGGGYYGTAGRRSYYDTHPRRPVNASGINKTTSGEGDGEDGGDVCGGGGGGGATTINDDEYTRITTPRQDVLFKKGYLSRPKPTSATATTMATTTTTTNATTSTSNENTASSSIAGTTSDGSDHGGNNSISTTASITSEFGGSFAADGSPLFPDYPYPYLPCGYFTENGVLVMNGFAVDNNGFSYFNGGQTYIYPPHFSNCQPGQQQQQQQQQQQEQPPSPVDPTDSMPYPAAANDETTNATNPDEGQPAPDGGESPMAVAADSPVVLLDGCRVDGNPCTVTEKGPCESEGYSAAIADCAASPDDASVSAVADAAGDGVTEGGAIPLVMPTAELPDYENGFYQLTDGYDFAQFWSSIYYQNWLMEQYPLYDDGGAPIYCTGEYALPNGGDVYTHQTGFKRRKKRFRTFEEIAGENGAPYVLGDVSSAIVHEGNQPVVGDEAASVLPPADGAQAPQEYRLNVDVQEFQPCTAGAPPQTPPNGGQATPVADAVAQHDQSHSSRVTKKPPPAVKLASKSSCKSSQRPPAAAAISHKIRKKDLIESTLAFAEQNIDLTRSKALASGLQSLDSELDCWTTIDRNGRKKRQERVVDAAKEIPLHPADGNQRGVALEKVATVPSGATAQPTVIATPPSASSSSSSSSSSTTSTTLVDQANAPQTTSSKRQDQQITKQSKKKTKSNKRQQHRKTNGGLHKQEGFQLIEPEFPSVASVGRQRARGGCDNVANDTDQLDETNDSREEDEEALEQVEQQQQQLLIEAQAEEQSVAVVEDEEQVVRRKEAEEVSETGAATLSGAHEEQRKEIGCVEQQQEQEQVPPEELNCDKAHGLVLATPSPSPSSAMAVVEEPTSVKKTENVMHQRRREEREPAQIAQPLDTETMEPRSASALPVAVVVDGPQEEIEPIVEGPVPEESVKPEHTRQQQSADSGVLTSAARQLELGERPSLPPTTGSAGDDTVAEDDGVDEEHEEEGEEEEEEEDESRGKRGSVSGSVGYTESIDSGLQSPVSPCGGGVASPEASSMVSSIESDETTTMDSAAAQSEAPLSQIVAKWLRRKLEVHEPEEVFVLPRDPLLIERLERFQLLQRRGGRRSRQGACSASDDSGDDLGDGSGDSDSDSDYMSDGQGRLERAADEDDDDTPSEVGSRSPPATDRTAQKLPLLNAVTTQRRPAEEQEQHAEAAPTKPPALSPSDSRSINSPAGAPPRVAVAASTSASGSDAKRCVIM